MKVRFFLRRRYHIPPAITATTAITVAPTPIPAQAPGPRPPVDSGAASGPGAWAVALTGVDVVDVVEEIVDMDREAEIGVEAEVEDLVCELATELGFVVTTFSASVMLK